MVLESFINPFKSEKKTWEVFLLGVLYSSAALFLSNWVFKEHASLLMVFLTVLACVPLLYSTMRIEETKDIQIQEEKKLLKEHSKLVVFILALFLGFVVSYVLWYIVLPVSFVQNTFSVQTSTIKAINARITGGFSGFETFTRILINNLKVLIFCILFAFLYGVGAIFILTWNASVIATAIGNYIRAGLSFYTEKVGVPKVAAYFQIISLGFLRYMIHGIPEMTAYFVAGVAGSIISVGIIREKFGTKDFEKVLLDSSDMVLIAIGILIIAALMEVYITPVLF